jgi:acyl carrier protein
MEQAMEIESTIRNFLNETLLLDEDSIQYTNDESFLKRNLIDSTTIMEIVLLVEANFGIEIQDNEIIPDNFDSVSKIANYVRSKLAQNQMPSGMSAEDFISLSDKRE